MEVQEAYDNLENLIAQGFITFEFSYNGLRGVLKSLSDKEYKTLYLYTDESDKIESIYYRLALSTYMMNGTNFLENRNNRIPELIDFYKKLPAVFTGQLIEYIEDLHIKYLDSVDCLEGFCYTKRSRFLWKALNNNLLVNANMYGIPGIENLGLSNIQENWIVVNKSLDQEEDYATQLNLSLIIASSLNGKGAKSISSKYESNKAEIDTYREEVIKYGWDKKRLEEQDKSEAWAAPLRTKEDLIHELNRQMTGVKDKHDLFMDKWYEQKIKKAEEAKNAIIKSQEEFKKKMLELPIDDSEGSKPISNADMEAKFKGKNVYSGAARSTESYATEDQQEKFLSVISKKIIRPENNQR